MSKVYLETIEIEALERATTNLRDHLLIRVLFHLGCRISEALGLEVKDIDFTQGMVTIEHLKSRIKLACPKCSAHLGKSHTYCPKCGVKVEEAVAKEQEHRRMRTLPLDGDTLEMLKDYIKRGGPVGTERNSYLVSTGTEPGKLLEHAPRELVYPSWLTRRRGRCTM